MDFKPVNMFATGCSTHRTSVLRTEKDEEWNIITYPCRVLRRLHNQLLSLQTINFETHMNAEDLVPVPIPRQKHTLVNTEQQKRRQHLCSALADKKAKSFESSYFCQECGDAFGGRVPLCDNIRRKEEVWHEIWDNDRNIPPGLKKKIRFRKRKDREED
ncbi:hypothetical protein GQ600_5761 [Phytophthora cactorum]|nr:hypothetical protein GQ600_5761 [Phytophthora cactorum]